MARTGKIARLPEWIRDEVNRRLREGIKAEPIVEWLNSHTDVRAVLDAEFAGRPIREQNLSDWRKGGYREWLAHRLALEDGMEVCARLGDLVHGSKVVLTENLAAFLCAHYALALKNATQPGAGGLDLKTLRAICSDVVALRRRDQEDQWLDMEERRQDFDEEHSKLRQLKALDREIDQLMEFLDRYDPKIKESWTAFRAELRKRIHGSDQAAAANRGEPLPPPPPAENENCDPNESGNPGKSG